jgi:outer membrane protein insertion porin family
MLCLLLLALGAGLFAAGETIYEIRVQGAKNVAAELVTSAISMRIGDPLDPEEVAKSIRQLYKMGVFADIQIHSEPYKNGVNLIIQVVENPVLTAIDYQGMKVVKKDRLDELINVRAGSFWSDFQKKQIIQKLTSEYTGKGYNNARVEVFENRTDDNKISVKVSVEEGKRVAITQVTFVGNKNFEDKTLLKRMKTKPANIIRSGRFEQEKFDKDLANLASFYKKNGYVDVRVGPYELKQTNDRSLELVINISEGTKYRLGGITVTGNENFTTETIGSTFTLEKGEAFDQEKFDKQLGNVYSMYFDEGYIYADINPRITKEADSLNVVLEVNEGTRARIRQIHITGNRRTKDKVLRRQLDIAPGDYYRQSQVIRTQQNIYNLGFFEPDIKLDYTRINGEGDIDLHIDVVDKSSGSANGGIGYNSEDNFVGQLSVSQNNLFGNNWSGSLTWEFGGSTQNFQLDFTNPNLLDTDVLLGSSLYYTTKDWSSFYYEIFTRGASLRLGQYLPFIDRTRLVAGYSLYSKKYRITNMDQILNNSDANATLIELDSLGWRYTSAVSATISRDTRDNIFFPTRGSQITLFSELAGGAFGGDFDYFKQIAQVNWYTETWYKVTLRTKWRFGYVTPYGRSDDAPPDEKFYLGGTGADGIRGYPDRSIGPDGGGSRAIIFSTELGYPIGGDQIIGVAFFDAGNSYNKLREFNFLNLKKGVGAGIRIRSPFGLIGFDYAYNLEEGGWEPHLQFGTTF